MICVGGGGVGEGFFMKPRSVETKWNDATTGKFKFHPKIKNFPLHCLETGRFLNFSQLFRKPFLTFSEDSRPVFYFMHFLLLDSGFF